VYVYIFLFIYFRQNSAQIMYTSLVSIMLATRPTQPILLHIIYLIFCDDQKFRSSLLCFFSVLLFALSFFQIFPQLPFPSINLSSFLDLRDQVSYPLTTTRSVVVLYIYFNLHRFIYTPAYLSIVTTIVNTINRCSIPGRGQVSSPKASRPALGPF
jgi:hypothetical protein